MDSFGDREPEVQRLIADSWPARLWMGVVPFAAPAAVLWITNLWAWLQSHGLNMLPLIALLFLAWVVGWFGAIIPGWLLLGPMYHAQGLSNGAPYRVGDLVRVPARRHRNRVARVYEVWAERDQVRLELDDNQRERVKDVFSYFEVCRQPNSPKNALRPTGHLIGGMSSHKVKPP
jgi:hypothetical protein